MFALLAVAIMVVVGMVMRRRAPAARAGGLAYQAAGQTGNSQFDPATPRTYSPQNVGNDASARPWERSGPAALDTRPNGGSLIGSALSGSQGWGVPAGFDVDGFLKASKANFVSLQDAWDRSDIPALRAMMTDDMLEQIRGQLAEREQASAGYKGKDALHACCLGPHRPDCQARMLALGCIWRYGGAHERKTPPPPPAVRW